MSNFAERPQNTPLNLSFQIAWELAYQKLLFQFLKLHDEFDGSAIAAWMRQQGLHDPDHHNLWGVQVSHYANLGFFIMIGRGIPSGAAHIAQVCIWKSASYLPKRKK
jgi:hypothetical protein